MIVQPTLEQTRRINRSRTYSGSGFGPRSFNCIGIGLGLGLGFSFASSGQQPGQSVNLGAFFTTPYQHVQSDLGLGYLAAMLTTGTGTPPTITVGGALNAGLVPPPIEVRPTSTGATGVWNYAIYADGGTTPFMTGTSPVGALSLTGVAAGLTLTFAAGTVTNTDNRWKACAGSLADQTVNGKNYTGSGVAGCPLVELGPNNYPYLTFDGSANFMTAATCALPTPGTTPWAGYAVFAIAGWTASRRIFSSTGGTSTAILYMNGVSPALQIFNATNGGVSSALPVGTPGCVEFAFGNAAGDYVRAGTDTAHTGSAGNTAGSAGRVIGASGTGTLPSNIKLLALTYAPQASAGQIAAWRAAAATMYGVTLAA